MNFTDLQMFIALCDTLHFGRASRNCHTAPSTLSRAIKRMEEEVEAELIERGKRVVGITPAGERFRTFAKETLSAWEGLKEGMGADLGEVRGEIRLYCSVTASYSVLPEILDQFRLRHPKVHIRLATGDANQAIDRLIDNQADISVAPIPQRIAKGIVAQVVTRTPLVFIAPSQGPVCEQLQRPVRWGRVPMILPESGLIRKYLIQWFKDKGVKPSVYSEVSGHEGIISLVGLGLGVGVVPRLVLEKSLIQTDIQELDVRPQLPDFEVGFCTKQINLDNSAVSAFWHILKSSR